VAKSSARELCSVVSVVSSFQYSTNFQCFFDFCVSYFCIQGNIRLCSLDRVKFFISLFIYLFIFVLFLFSFFVFVQECGVNVKCVLVVLWKSKARLMLGCMVLLIIDNFKSIKICAAFHFMYWKLQQLKMAKNKHEIMNMWKHHVLEPPNKDWNVQKIIAVYVMYATFVIAKRKPEKIQAYRGFELMTTVALKVVCSNPTTRCLRETSISKSKVVLHFQA